jgi:hypothetical protein
MFCFVTLIRSSVAKERERRLCSFEYISITIYKPDQSNKIGIYIFGKNIYFLFLSNTYICKYAYALNMQHKKKNSNFNETKVEISSEEMGH